MQNILITGGAGFIGHALTKRLVKEGFNVFTLDNLSNASIEFTKDENTIIGDITDLQIVETCISNIKPSIVIHLAALHYIPECIKNPEKTTIVNVKGTKNILDAIVKFTPKAQFLFASSAAVYMPTMNPLTETSEIGPVDIYGNTKLEAEKLIGHYSELYAIKYTILRLFNVYGYKDSTSHLIPQILEQLKLGNKIMLGNIDKKRDYVFIDDIVEAFLKVVLNLGISENKVFNVGTGKSYSAKHIVDHISAISGVTIEINCNTETLTRLNDRPVLLADYSKITETLDWKPEYHLAKGLKKILNDFLFVLPTGRTGFPIRVT